MTTNDKPIRTANNNCRQYVMSLTLFKGSNLFSEIRGRLYIVYSYGKHWPLFVHDGRTGIWYENNERFSRSTGRHHSQAHPRTPTQYKSCDDLIDMIDRERLTVEQDGRWAFQEEYVGQEEPQWVARWCGDFMGCAPTYDGAVALATAYQWANP